MTRKPMNMQSWFIIAILLTGIIACIVPAAAESISYIQVSTNPSGAWACFDHYNCQQTPTTYSAPSNTYHSITVYQDGYQGYTQTIYASDPGSTTNVMVTLTSNPSQTGTLGLDSNPADAAIWLDNLYYGTTPQNVGGLSEGIHSLTLKKAGYFDFTESIMISAGETTSMAPTMIQYASSSGFGDLQIRSNPAGAAVYVDGNYKGTTIASNALYVTQLNPGSYSVRVTLANYQPYTETAVVTAGRVSNIQANLVLVTPGPTPNLNGLMTVRSNPSGANIYLDNAFRGLTPLTLVDVPEGSHTVILKMNGYLDWQSSVNVPGSQQY